MIYFVFLSIDTLAIFFNVGLYLFSLTLSRIELFHIKKSVEETNK